MPSSMHNVIVLAHVIILSFMCACCKANLKIIIIIIILELEINEIIRRAYNLNQQFIIIIKAEEVGTTI